ncbi:MAG: glycosyltransferase family 2 protein [Actinomycetota bacterium]|nr:glycosyltransferase family 2 protein [Actinomycetota bacterium]
MTRKTPRFELVVVAYKSRQALVPFLGHLGTNVPVILVDNSFHEDDLGDVVDRYPNVRHIDSGGNLGYSAASNLGARESTADCLIFMNPDTQPSANALEALIDYLEAHPTVGCCGAAGINTAGGGAQPTVSRVTAHALGLHRRLPLAGLYYQDIGGRRIDVGWVAGSCLAIRRKTFTAVGGFDPRYFIYQSDFDLGMRIAQRGLRQVVLGDVVIPHTDGGSSDLPSTWTWEKRGRAWTRFLRNTRRRPAALLLSGLLLAGYGVRAVLYTAMRRHNRAHEMRTYVIAGVREWISPEPSPF